jgi:hypothetical protein
VPASRNTLSLAAKEVDHAVGDDNVGGRRAVKCPDVSLAEVGVGNVGLRCVAAAVGLDHARNSPPGARLNCNGSLS